MAGQCDLSAKNENFQEKRKTAFYIFFSKFSLKLYKLDKKIIFIKKTCLDLLFYKKKTQTQADSYIVDLT